MFFLFLLKVQADENIIYEINTSTGEAYVSDIVADHPIKDLNISATHNGVNVTSIRKCSCINVTGCLRIPSTVKKICSFALFGSSFNSVIFEEGLEKIEGAAFEMSVNLSGQLILPSTLEILGKCCFAYTNLSTIFFDDCKFTKISASSFADIKSLQEISDFPETLEIIEDGAFENCPKLSLSNGLFSNIKKDLSLGMRCFCNCSSITEINPPPFSCQN